MSLNDNWHPKDPKEAFFPVEKRPLYMPATGSV